MTLIATPPSTHAAVAPNQTRPHLGVMSGNVTDTSTRLGRPGETRVLLKEQASKPSRTVTFMDKSVTRSSGSPAWRGGVAAVVVVAGYLALGWSRRSFAPALAVAPGAALAGALVLAGVAPWIIELTFGGALVLAGVAIRAAETHS